MISPAFGLAMERQASNILELADSYGSWKGIRSNHVITNSGDFKGSDGSSRSITTPEDRELLIELRRRADIVVVDAKTARNEAYKARSSGAALAIFSATGNFSDIPAVEDQNNNCYLFGPQPSTKFQNCRHELIQNLANPLSGLAEWAANRGLPALLLEAGPTFTRIAFANGLVRQSALTIAAQGLDLEQVSKMHPFDQNAKLLSVASASGASFTYWHH
jgi:riboflavin biosynthesis pyrimidine reductase